jgi:hypothetical protein
VILVRTSLTESEQGFGSLEIKRAESFGEAVKNGVQQITSCLASALVEPMVGESRCGSQFKPSGTFARCCGESLAKILLRLLGFVVQCSEFSS